MFVRIPFELLFLEKYVINHIEPQRTISDPNVIKIFKKPVFSYKNKNNIILSAVFGSV